MSLRTKILLLFAILAVVPMVAMAVADYYQSLYALGAVIETKAEAVSEARARAIVDGHAEVELALARMAGAPALRRLLDSRPSSPQTSPAVFTPGDALMFRRLELLDSARRSLASMAGTTSPTARSGPASCHRGPLSASFEWPVTSEEGRIIGYIRGTPRAEALFPPVLLAGRFGVGGMNLVIDRSTGAIIFAEPCDLVGQSVVAVLGVEQRLWREVLRSGSGAFRARRDNHEYIAAAAPVPRAGWVYLTVVPLNEFTTPYGRARSLWLLLVLAVASVTGVGFVLATRRPLLGLRRLSAAAEAVGRGEFSVWLPPASDGEVGRLAQAFGQMTFRLKELMRQAEFGRQLQVVGKMGAYVAHEIRNPLGAISIYLEGLARHVDEGRMPPNASKVLHLALDELRRLEDVVTSFLALGQTKSGARREVPLHTVAEQALLVLRGELRRRGLRSEISAASEDTVVADQAALQGAIVNLLLNAADSAPADSSIRLWTDAGRGPEGEPVVQLHVADEGPGVAPELRERIFEPFFTTKARGSGIGLPVARQVVQEHGGRLFCQAVPGGGGAEFVLELPLAPLSTGVPAAAASPQGVDPAEEVLAMGSREAAS